MPNYLQRIVISGARTTSPAKPPAISHTPMPPIGSSVRTSTGEEERRAPEVDGIVDSVLPAMRTVGDVPLEPGTPIPALQDQSVVAREVNVQSPPSEQVHDPVAKHKPLSVESKLPLPPAPAVSAVTVFAPRALRRNANRNRGQQITSVVEETSRQLSPHSPEGHFESKPALQTPGEMVIPAQSETPHASEFHDRPEPKQTVVSPTPLTAKVPNPHIPSLIAERKVQEGEVQKAAEAEPLPILKSPKIQSTETKPRVEPVQDSQISQPVVKPLAKRPLAEAGSLEDRISAPKQPAQRGVFNTADKRRGSRISIGRIDVQVNNLPPRETTAPAPAKQPVYSNFLEARHLDRFFLKL
jgi:hypothetical protein